MPWALVMVALVPPLGGPSTEKAAALVMVDAPPKVCRDGVILTSLWIVMAPVECCMVLSSLI